MAPPKFLLPVSILVGAGIPGAAVEAQPVTGFVAAESLTYFEEGLGDGQIGRLNGEISTYRTLTDQLRFDMRLYGSLDLENDDGSYFDPSVAKLSYSSGPLLVAVGYDVLFWGVVESRNIVNIFNQRDLMRDLDGDVALGQPMVAVSYLGGDFTLAAYVLPGFRELNVGSLDLRLGFPLPVRDDLSTFESDDGDDHVDYAAQFDAAWGDVEFGAAVFDGTLREPVLQLRDGELIPFYPQGTFYGVDLQYTRGGTLFKFEGRHVEPDSSDEFDGAVYGIEQLVSGPFGTPYELNLYAEHNVDSRRNNPSVVFQNDLFVGARLSFANTLDTWVRVGVFYDLDYGSVLGSARLRTRLTDQLSFEAVGYFAEVEDEDDPLTGGSNIDQLRVALAWNF